MSDDVTTLLDRATPTQVDELDYNDLVRRGHRRRWTKRATGAAASVISAAALTAGVLMVQEPPSLQVLSTPTAGSCTTLDVEVLPSVEHFQAGDPATPTAEEVYTAGRPTASGPHYANFAPVGDGVAPSQLDERATTHNLEHGAIVIWFDPGQLDAQQIEQIDATVAELHDDGFAEHSAGAGVLASPFTDPGIDSGAAVALRAWGTAFDCGAWDTEVARQFVIDNYGTNGTAPEGGLAPHPGSP